MIGPVDAHRTTHFYRKVEGETKGDGHGEGHGVFDGSNVSLRRWEDWERSRLRKLRREERRRRDFERSHPNGYHGGDGDFLAPSARTSQYDGSDAVSVTSSEGDDQWGGQIGGYNENSGQYPAPPPGLYKQTNDSLQHAPTLAGTDLEAMLEEGFDDSPGPQQTRFLQAGIAPRFHLSDAPSPQVGYSPIARVTSPGPQARAVSPPSGGAAASGAWRTHAKRRSGGRSSGDSPEKKYGPLGPLDPGPRF